MKYREIREEYETTMTSYAKLSKKYNVSAKTIERTAKKEEWIKKKSDTPTATTADHTDAIREKEERLHTLYDKSDILAEFEAEILMDSYAKFKELQEEVRIEGRMLTGSKGTPFLNPKYTAMQMEKANILKITKQLRGNLSLDKVIDSVLNINFKGK